MLRINYSDQSIFSDMSRAVDNYCRYSSAILGIKLNNPFVRDPNGIPVIPFQELDQIRACESTTILIDLITEGFNSHDYLDQYPKDKNYILFTNGKWNTRLIDINHVLLYWNYFLFNYIDRAVNVCNVDAFQNRVYNFTNDKDLVFSATIGVARSWRDSLVLKLTNGIEFKNYILNYNGKELARSSRDFDIAYDFNNYSSYDSIVDHFTMSSSIPIEMYDRSRSLLIVETNAYDHDEFHLTEKTIKALLVGIPFIVAGSYKFLKNLRELGFKTYDEIWDESYDDIADTDQRMSTIVDLLNNINAMEWDESIVEKARLIALHNKDVLLNVNVIMKKQIHSIIENFKSYEI